MKSARKNFSLTGTGMKCKPFIFFSVLVVLILFLHLLEAYRGHQNYRGPRREGALRRRRKLGFSRTVQVFYNDKHKRRQEPGSSGQRCRHLTQRLRSDSCGLSKLQKMIKVLINKCCCICIHKNL